MKFILLGGAGYVGSAFQAELDRRGAEYLAVSRSQVDYGRYGELVELLRSERPSFLINCAGYTGKPNVDACEKDRAGTLRGNVVLAETIACACEAAGVPWGHVSSGCIYSGAKLQPPGEPPRVERDLLAPAVRELWQRDRGLLRGFTEQDTPNFSFRQPPCSFYSGTKALGEEVLAEHSNLYMWRLRIPFDEFDSPRNYLTKIQRYPKVYDNVNSLSHRGDFARACLDLCEKRAPFGTYNVTNPGWVTTRDVVERLTARLQLDRSFDYFESDDVFYQSAAATPRSNCILDTSKLLAAGVTLRPVQEALDDALANWTDAASREKLVARS